MVPISAGCCDCSCLQPAAVLGAGGILSKVDICIRTGNQFTLRPVSAMAWRVVSFTGLARSLRACALTATGPYVCERLQRSVDNRTCVCKPGHTGTSCEINIHNLMMDSKPCQNGGYAGMNGTCICSPGFTGTNCEWNIDDCPIGDYCQNGAACVDDINSFFCLCPPGISGVRCEIVPCAANTANPCQNGGTCTDGVNGYICSCKPGYSGTNCEIMCATNPCQNGGTCTAGVNGYTCNCPLGYTGTTCQQPQSKSRPVIKIKIYTTPEARWAPGCQGPTLACAVVCMLYCCAEVPQQPAEHTAGGRCLTCCRVCASSKSMTNHCH